MGVYFCDKKLPDVDVEIFSEIKLKSLENHAFRRNSISKKVFKAFDIQIIFFLIKKQKWNFADFPKDFKARRYSKRDIYRANQLMRIFKMARISEKYQLRKTSYNGQLCLK